VTRLGFIGGGNMAEALISGLIRAKLLAPDKIQVSDIRDDRLEVLAAKYKVKCVRNNLDIVRENETIILAVKPQQVKEVLDEIASSVESHQLVISIVAGIPIRFLEAKFTRAVPVVRVMPNTAAGVQEVAAGVSAGSRATAVHRDLVVRLFNAIGEAAEVSEDQMDAVTALSGSGPAYVFHLVEALIAAGKAEGLSEDTARALAVQTVYGAAKMLSQMVEDPGALRKQVTSPGGTTEAAFKVLEEKGWAGILQEAVHAARVRSEELAESV